MFVWMRLRLVGEPEQQGMGNAPFDWDPDKVEANEDNYGVRFSEAATAFGDPLSITIPDPDHSVGEARFVLVGLSHVGRLVVVAHAETNDSIRIISPLGHESRAPILRAVRKTGAPSPRCGTSTTSPKVSGGSTLAVSPRAATLSS